MMKDEKIYWNQMLDKVRNKWVGKFNRRTKTTDNLNNNENNKLKLRFSEITEKRTPIEFKSKR